MRLAPLMIMTTVAWLLILVESYIFFEFIVPFPQIHEVGVLAQLALLKVGLTFGLGAAWFAIMFLLRYFYVRSRGAARPPS